MTATGATQARNASRPWLAHYPPAVPPELDDAKVGTLVDLIGSACSTYASRPAFEFFIQRHGFFEVAGIALVDGFAVNLVGAPARSFIHRCAAAPRQGEQ